MKCARASFDELSLFAAVEKLAGGEEVMKFVTGNGDELSAHVVEGVEKFFVGDKERKKKKHTKFCVALIKRLCTIVRCELSWSLGILGKGVRKSCGKFSGWNDAHILVGGGDDDDDKDDDDGDADGKVKLCFFLGGDGHRSEIEGKV